MNFVTIPAKNVTQEIPSCIDELNERQFIRFIELILLLQDNKISFQSFKILLIQELIHLKVNFSFRYLPKEDQELAWATVYQLSDLAESFFKEEQRDSGPVKVAQLSFVRQFIPRMGAFYGPEYALLDATFCEYRMARDYFAAFLKSDDPEDLNRMIAVLYRRRKRFLFIRKWLSSYDGQHRRPITFRSNPALIERRAKKIARHSFAVRYAVFLWFAGCEEYLVKGCPVINGHEIDFSKLYEKREKKSGNLAEIGLVGVLFSLAETKVFGNMEETDSQNLYDVMLRLYQVVMQAKEIEEKYGTGKKV